MRIHITPDPLTHPSTLALLTEHHTDLQTKTPASSSRYVLPLTTLQHDPTITVYTAWDATTHELLGCGALRELSPAEAELKSMRTVTAHLRKGVARTIALHIMDVARERGYQWLRLETGTGEAFAAARRLYAGLGFRACGVFGGYVASERNCFMEVELGG
ncbi:hypothetical protein ASPCADRAFT_179629 [Aspergillus carbonarius ITEM 5010]|uniref:N-acetyltransferase domain-containing protein n=1 Tax=Aspergillus carbonarius (strain ITEM 5010) TaxID=602072 RepID=A0A1R3R6Q3_ASPC5|nr:hypothetical protein ASPCADRAFT_179629 [Aspergillus carbonarius ITEM 5010]